jgi:hypothetical protein
VRGRLMGTKRVARGQRARLFVRPSGVRFRSSDVQSGTTVSMAGLVRDSAFRGWGYEHAVEVAGGQLLAGVASPFRVPAAERVELMLVETGCLVAPVGQAPASWANESAELVDAQVAKSS